MNIDSLISDPPISTDAIGTFWKNSSLINEYNNFYYILWSLDYWLDLVLIQNLRKNPVIFEYVPDPALSIFDLINLEW